VGLSLFIPIPNKPKRYLFLQRCCAFGMLPYICSTQTNTATMNKQSLLLRIGSQLMNDYNSWVNSSIDNVELNKSSSFFGSLVDSAQDVHDLISKQ
jgi:hypothetical protein